jgi:hypothetical protein
MKATGALVLAAGAMLATAAVAPAVPSARSVAFRTVAHDAGTSSSVTGRTAVVVRRDRRWRSLWRDLNAGAYQRPPLPRVDFSRQMLILVTQGRQSSGGYSITVESVRDDGTRLIVSARERAPGSSCATPQVLTAPYHVVRVRRSSKPVSVRRHLTTYEC